MRSGDTDAPAVRAGRDRPVETARGVACLLVVVFHVLGASTVTGLALPEQSPWAAFNRVLDYVHMPAFAFLGGIAYGYSPLRRSSAASFARKKAMRIALPLLVATTLYLAAQFLVPTSSARPDPAWHAYVYPYLHLWYLQALLWVLAAVALLDALGLLRGPGLALAFVGSVVVFSHRGAWLPPELGVIVGGYLLPFFLAGLAWQRHGGLLRGWAVPSGLVGVSALGVLAWGVPLAGWAEAALRLTAGIGLTSAFLAARPDWRWAVWLGGLSYPVYLYHVFGTGLARHALHGLGVSEVWPHLLVGTAAGIGAGTAVRTASRVARDSTGLNVGTALLGEPGPHGPVPLPVTAHGPGRGDGAP